MRFELTTPCLQGRCNNHYATPAFVSYIIVIITKIKNHKMKNEFFKKKKKTKKKINVKIWLKQP